MSGHRTDDLVDHLHNRWCPWIGGIQHANCVRQLLDRNRAVIIEAGGHQFLDAIRRPPLHTIYEDTCIEEERLTANRGIIDKGKLCDRPSGQRFGRKTPNSSNGMDRHQTSSSQKPSLMSESTVPSTFAMVSTKRSSRATLASARRCTRSDQSHL